MYRYYVTKRFHRDHRSLITSKGGKEGVGSVGSRGQPHAPNNSHVAPATDDNLGTAPTLGRCPPPTNGKARCRRWCAPSPPRASLSKEKDEINNPHASGLYNPQNNEPGKPSAAPASKVENAVANR
ncbi:hypothetical protein CEXT_528111 [Caerostris extrusa]|uniref:Uncharacterized protein n=1 Tax=Caerostris extrusa TaxID=172846 RepID=A0AAV4R9L7_CAEEX|nr:hypothetical protein CEXT_528111 [Caerostris extrusa]